jgi:uncharacterized protein (TIGR02466 family)
VKIETIFANWVAYENLSLDNKSIEEFCYRKRNEDPVGRIMTNRGGWQSNDLYEKDSELKELTNIIIGRIRNLAKNFDYSNPNDLQICNYWININKKNNDNAPHTHPISVISAVYYVKVPENSGEIIFHTPLQNYDEFIFEDMIEKYNAYNSSNYRYIPKTGDLILFPSWLSHNVSANQSEEERISIAFNGNFKNRKV